MDVLNGYRDKRDVSSDTDSESSDKECTIWKRATLKRTHEDVLTNVDEEIKEPTVQSNEQPQPVKRERKRNTVWSEVLQDQLISEDLEDCLLKNKPHNYGSRGKESYDYTLKYSDTRSEKDSDSHMSESGLIEEPSKLKIKHSPSFRNNVKKFVKLNSAEFNAARKINKILNEKKFYLIQRIVKTVGIEKSMELLNMTQDIEENGGMMVNSNARRRTPGGVYIQLLKTDKGVTQEMLDKIFEGEMSAFELKKYYAEKKKDKKKFMQNKGNKQKPNDLYELSKIHENIQEAGEFVPMDAEITANVNSENSSVSSNPTSMPTLNKNSSESIFNKKPSESIFNKKPPESIFNKKPPESIFNKNTSESISDLEEGEIED